MGDLLRINWQAVNWPAGIKITVGLIVMLVLTHLTGESWIATALVAMFAWLANTPGPLFYRVRGMLVFGLCAALFTLLSGKIGLAVVPNVIAVAVIGFFATMAATRGTRAFMVGWSVICWVIYAPFLVSTTSVDNCLLAVIAGTGIVILLNIVGDLLFKQNTEEPQEQEPQAEAAGPGFDYFLVYAVTVAVVMAFTTYFGWSVLKTDPTMMAGGAFFVLGFDPVKTWTAGVARVMGLVGGVVIGLGIAALFGPGLVSNIIMILSCGLSFAAFAVHPGAWMFFFMIFVAIGWPSLDPQAFELAVNERFFGEIVGIIAAMAGISFLHFWQKKKDGTPIG